MTLTGITTSVANGIDNNSLMFTPHFRAQDGDKCFALDISFVLATSYSKASVL